jgi:hypothetical protein
MEVREALGLIHMKNIETTRLKFGLLDIFVDFKAIPIISLNSFQFKSSQTSSQTISHLPTKPR